MIYGSLFSGIGLLDLGVEMAFRDAGVPLQCAWQVEINPFCRAVLAKHWPEVPKYEDVTRVGSTGHALAPIDLIVGGFPCQDVSVAGVGRGLRGGERSWLWFEYLRIVRELEPRAIIVENVHGLIRRGLVDIVTGLSDSGFAVEASRIQAGDVGSPHRRERILIVAVSTRLDGRPSQSRYNSIRGSKRPLVHKTGTKLAHASSIKRVCSGLSQPRLGRDPNGRPNWLDGVRWPAPPGKQYEWEPPRTKADVANRSARLKSLGNAVVPQCAYVAAMRAIERLG